MSIRMIVGNAGTPGRFLSVMVLAGAALALAVAAPCVCAQEQAKMDWMPAEIDDKGLNAQAAGGEMIIPEIIITETPKPTADMTKFTREYVIELGKFNISNAGLNPVETSKGLNLALQYAKTLRANRIVFPKGTYLISETDPVVMDHKDTIIDLNGSTLQVNTNGRPQYSIVNIVDGAENFRLTNGTIRGDRDTHDYTTVKGSHESCEALVLFSGKNLEVDHLTLANTPGFCVASKANGSRTRTELLSKIIHRVYVSHLQQGGFDDQGRKVANPEKTRTIEPYDITKCGGEFEFGYTQEYYGFPYVKGRIYQAYFYDMNRKLIEKRRCLQFKKIKIPEGAEYLHLEFNQPKVEGDPNGFCGRITNFNPPTDVHFHDNHIVDNRALGMAFCGGQQWLFEDNLFEKNGPDVVGWGFDFEDGWELMQNIVLKNNVFKGNLKGDLVICGGTELMMDGNTFDSNVLVHGRPHNYVFKNNKFTGGYVRYTTRTGIAKIHDNTCDNCNVSITFDTKAVADGLYRKPGETVATPPLALENETLSNVKRIAGTYLNFTDAKIANAQFVAGAETRMVSFKNCEFDGVSLEYEAKGPVVNVTIENCKGNLEQKGPGLARRKMNP